RRQHRTPPRRRTAVSPADCSAGTATSTGPARAVRTEASFVRRLHATDERRRAGPDQHGMRYSGAGSAEGPASRADAMGERSHFVKTVLILGAGFAGLELATTLSEEVPDDVDVTIVDSSDAFVFGYSKLDIMFGRQSLHDVRLPYSRLNKPSVRFVRETVISIDPTQRRVTTDASVYEPDILVVALGADLEPSATPGLVEEGTEYYSVEGADRVGRLLPAFEGGDVIVGVLGPFFKCPAAPFETALMMHDFLERRGLRSRSTIKVVSPMPR